MFVCLFVAPPDEKEVDGKIWIEFDDGDSGFFQLNEIKRIHPDFPVEGEIYISLLYFFVVMYSMSFLIMSLIPQDAFWRSVTDIGKKRNITAFLILRNCRGLMLN